MTDRLIQRLDADTARGSVEEICQAVKKTLAEEIVDGRLELAPELMQPVSGDYGRRLLHRDPEGRYVVVVMTWGPGQGTPIHDHAGQWCVECVYRGRIRVTSYDLLGGRTADIVGFEKTSEVDAGRGAAGSLIPPFDYHVIHNPNHETAVTIHVYGGEMEDCDVFTPVDGSQDPIRYRRERRRLSYTP